MKAAFHKLTTCFLLCLAALPLLFTIYIQTSQSILHEQMREELEENKLVTIRVSTSALSWTESGKEVIIDGKMFDVERFAVEGNAVVLTGLFDTDEDAIITMLDGLEKNNSDGTSSTLAMEWFSLFSFIQEKEPNHFLTGEQFPATSLLQYNRAEDPVLSCDTPPPENRLS